MLRKEEVRIADTYTDCTLAEGVMELRKSHVGGGVLKAPGKCHSSPLGTKLPQMPLNVYCAELGDFSFSQILQNLWAPTG